MMHLRVLGLAAVVAGSLGFVPAASAAPIGLGAVAPETGVIPVLGGCGPGFAPGRFGYCRPFYGPRPYWGPRPFYGPRRFYGPRPYGYRPYGPPRRFYYGY